MLNVIKRTLGYFDDYGLKYSVAHLNSADHRELLNESLPQMARYHDRVTEHLIASEPASLSHMLSCCKQPVQFPLNTTAIGNCAYIILHSSSDQLKQHAKGVLQKYMHWLNIQN